MQSRYDLISAFSCTVDYNILFEQERALLKAEEAKAPVDRRNPWGGVAERFVSSSYHLVLKNHLVIKLLPFHLVNKSSCSHIF